MIDFHRNLGIVHFLVRLDSEWTWWHLTVAHDFYSYLMMFARFSSLFQPLHWMHHEKLCSFFGSVTCWIFIDFHNQHWICTENEDSFTLILSPIKEKPIGLAPDLMHNVKWWVYRTFDNGWQSRHHSNLSLSTQPLALHSQKLTKQLIIRLNPKRYSMLSLLQQEFVWLLHFSTSSSFFNSI